MPGTTPPASVAAGLRSPLPGRRPRWRPWRGSPATPRRRDTFCVLSLQNPPVSQWKNANDRTSMLCRGTSVSTVGSRNAEWADLVGTGALLDELDDLVEVDVVDLRLVGE